MMLIMMVVVVVMMLTTTDTTTNKLLLFIATGELCSSEGIAAHLWRYEGVHIQLLL